MPASHKFRFRNLLVFTTLPALVIGAALWGLASLLPTCGTTEHARLTSPDKQFDILVFSRSCGADTGPNTQAALIPAGDQLPDDAASFVSVGADADLAPHWLDASTIELTLPPAAKIYRNDDSVAGVSIRYR